MWKLCFRFDKILVSATQTDRQTSHTISPVSVVQQLFSLPLVLLCTPQLPCKQNGHLKTHFALSYRAYCNSCIGTHTFYSINHFVWTLNSSPISSCVWLYVWVVGENTHFKEWNWVCEFVKWKTGHQSQFSFSYFVVCTGIGTMNSVYSRVKL